MYLWDLCIHIDTNTGFQFNRAAVVPYCDLLKPEFYKHFIKCGKVRSLWNRIEILSVTLFFNIAFHAFANFLERFNCVERQKLLA